VRLLNDLLDYIVGQYSLANLSLGDLEALVEHCQGAELVVELGTQMGNTTRLLSMLAGQVVSVDVFDKLSLIEDPDQSETYRKDYDLHPHDLAIVSGRLADRRNIRLVQDRTDLAAKTAQIPDKSVDVLIIDADHSYTGAKKDYTAWLPKVAIGGTILFHDAVSGFPGVVRLCDELAESPDVFEIGARSCRTSFRTFKKCKAKESR